MRLFRVVLAAAAASVLVFAGATPALAHDELIGSSPEAGERLDAAPDYVELRFSGDVLTIGAAVIIVDASGRDWVTNEPEVVNGSVVVPLETGMPDAGYEIRWRVVSADGHPISGLVPFTVGDGEPFERTPSSPAEETDAGETDAGNASPEDAAESAIPRAVLIGAGGAVVAAGVFLLITLLRRRSRADADTAP